MKLEYGRKMNNKREYWIDWLRISCSWLIVIYHANRLFDEKGTKNYLNIINARFTLNLNNKSVLGGFV